MLFCKYWRHDVDLKCVDICKDQNGKGIWGKKRTENGFHRALLWLIYLSRVLCEAFLHNHVFRELVCKCRCLHFLDYSPFTLECKPSYTHHRQASVTSGKGHSQHSSLCWLILQESPVFMDSNSDQMWWKHDSGEREDHGHAYTGTALVCRMPRFKQFSQQRSLSKQWVKLATTILSPTSKATKRRQPCILSRFTQACIFPLCF